MDYEKINALQATTDIEPIISDTFFLDGQLTDIYLYPQEIHLMQKDNNKIIPIRFGLSFNIAMGANDQPQALEFSYNEQIIRLERDFWPRHVQWETTLLKYMIRKDFHSFFKPIKKIGRGNFGTVYLAQENKLGRYAAIKAFIKEMAFKGNGKASIENEIRIMRKLKHPNLVTFHGAYETKNSLYLSMEYAKGITLESFLRKKMEITVSQRRLILKGLLMGLKELTRLRIVHRDIKPQNIIISQDCGTIKIVDFGLATEIDHQKYLFVRCGTPGFVAPQILNIRDNQKAKLGINSDMFSVGAIYYNLLYGHPLFKGKNQGQVLNLNRQAKFKLIYTQNAASGQLQLLNSMLQSDPANRISPQEALQSNFLSQHKSLLSRDLQSIQVRGDSSWIICYK